MTQRLDQPGMGYGMPQIFLYRQRRWCASWLRPDGLRDYYVITLSLRWRWQDTAGPSPAQAERSPAKTGQATMNALDMKMIKNGALGVPSKRAMQTLDDFLMENLPGIPVDLVRARLAGLKTPKLEAV